MIVGHIARSQLHTPSRGVRRTPGAWHGASPAAPATTAACTSDAEVLGPLYSHEFVLARLIALADALGCMWDLLSPLPPLLPLPFFDLELTRFAWSLPFSGVPPKASADDGIGPEIPETSRNYSVNTENANHDTFADTPPVPLAAASLDQDQNGNILYWAVSNLSMQLMALQRSLSERRSSCF